MESSSVLGVALADGLSRLEGAKPALGVAVLAVVALPEDGALLVVLLHPPVKIRTSPANTTTLNRVMHMPFRGGAGVTGVTVLICLPRIDLDRQLHRGRKLGFFLSFVRHVAH